MRRGNGAHGSGGGRGGGNWRQFQQQHPREHQGHHAQYHQPYSHAQPPPPQHQQQPQPQPRSYAHAPPLPPVPPMVTGVPPLPALGATGTSIRPGVQEEVTAFVHALRTSQSHPSAPPNALSFSNVSHAICAQFQVSDLEELLGVPPLQLSILRQLHTLNQRLWTFVTCFVQGRRINTLYECFQMFLTQEGIHDFHELRIGNSFLHTEAVQSLYHGPTAMLNVSTRDILNHLRQFETMIGHDAFRNSTHIDRGEFLQYLSQQYRQPNVEKLGIALDPSGFGVYIGMLRRISNQEMKEMKTMEQEFQKGIAEAVFELSKEKFSAANRKKALDELLKSHLGTANDQEQDASGGGATEHSTSSGQWKKRASTNTNKSSTASLSLEMLKRVTDIDVYLDNVLRRKAANEQRNNQTQISSQEIAETDLKIRNQLTRFLVATQKSKHHSRIKVVTWVLCGIMAKIHSLLLHDDKLPDEKATDGEEDDEGKAKSDKKKKADDNDDDDSDDECDCCCIGKDTCKCDCKCECHSNSSDEEEEEADEKEKKPSASKSTTSSASSKSSKRAPELSIFDAASMKQEIEQYLTNYCESNDIESLDQLLMCFISLEIHLRQTMGIDRNLDRSALELVLDVWNDAAESKKEGNGNDKTKVWFQTFERLLSSQSSDLSSFNNANDREEIAQFIQQCFVASTSSSSSRSVTKAELVQQVSARAYCEFGFDVLERLGAESMDALLEEARQSVEEKNAGVNTSPGIVKYSSVLLPASEFHLNEQGTDDNNSGGVVSSFPGESLRLKKTEEAIEALLQCPFLVDVAKFTCWQQSFAPYCGSLRIFIRTHEMMLADHASSSSRSLMFLFCLHGVVLRVNEESTPSALEMLISASPDQVVSSHLVGVHLTSMLVKNGGQQNFPKQLVQAHLKSLFAVAKARQGNDDTLLRLERYVLEVLLVVPVEFAGFVYSLLAEVAAEGASAQTRFAEQVWNSCGNDIERRALASIAKSSRNVVWMDKQFTLSQDQDVDVVMTDVSSSVSIPNVDGSSSSSSLSLPSSSSGEFASTSKADDLEISDRFVRAQQSSPSPPAATELAIELNALEEGSVTVASSSPESCRECIDTIRKEQFGIGLEILDEATSSVLTIQQKRLERALKRLSDELYSENTHFVLELLQNADDNSYDQGTRAKGEFILTSAQEVVFHNNERGFSSANIQAICDVGASTKAAQDSSTSIGKKGIGFKSVFKISDSPQVHSNGFHIRFHSKNDAHGGSGGGGLGYILPFWIDDKAEWKLQKGTTFVLPLNQTSLQRVDEISESLMAFEPSILLFLRRIQELLITDQVHRQTLHFLKEVSTRERYQTVQLFSQIGCRGSDRVAVSQQQWLVVKRKLQAPAAFATTADQVRETEIAIALPLDSSSDEASGDRPPLQQVFAYLPLRSYGFRFIVQGDFEVPSSREAIVNGSEWNQWLISQVPGLMKQVVMCFVDELKVSKKADVVAQITHFLSLLPFENEIQAPFRSIVLDTMREVSQIPFLPAALTSTENSSSLELVKPVQLLDAWEAVQDDEILSVLTSNPDLLFATLNKKLLHLELAKSLQLQQKNQLKIERLKASHILQLLAHAAAKNDVSWTVEVLRVLGKLWKKDRHSNLLLQELRLIKCFPLQSQDGKKKEWISLMETGDALFLPPVSNDEKSSSSGSVITKDPSPSDSFYGDLHVLDNDFAVAISSLPDARSFLIAQVKIKMIEDHDLISHHILPKMELLGNSRSSAATGADENLQVSKTVGTLKRYSKFLASHLLTCSNCPVEADIQAKMRVWTFTGKLVPASASNVFVMLPATVGEMPELSKWLQDKLKESDSSRSFDMVGCDYFVGSQMEPSKANRNGAAWQKLFVDTLKLPMAFDVTDVRVAVAFKQVLKWLHGEANSQVKENLSRELVGYLNKHWPTTRGDADGTLQGDETVAELLRKTKWLSGTDGKFHRPDTLWVATSASKSLFSGSMVPFSRVTWINDVLVEDILKLKRTPTLEDALSVLSSLSSLVKEDTELLNVSAVSRIYMFLAEQAQQAPASAQAIKQAFSERSLVFTPPHEEAADDGMSSKFVGVKDVVWSSTSCNGRLIPLEQSYPKSLRHFFTEVCGVEKKPSIHSLCKRLEQIKNEEDFERDHDAKKQWKREMLPVLQFFAKQIAKLTLSKDEQRRIRKTLKVTPWLPVSSSASEHKKLQWCTAKDEPIVPTTDDERELQKVVLSLQKDIGSTIQSADRINLVKMDQELLEELDPLIKLSKIRSLTAHVVSEPSAWCDLISASVTSLELAQEEKDKKKMRKKIQKLVKTLLVLWSKAFATDPSVWTKADKQFQWKLQQSLLFPTVRDQHFMKPADVFINDQTELSKESLAGDDSSSAANLQPALPIMSLFPWDYFTDESSLGVKQEATQVRDCLLSFCGAKSLKAQLSYEVIVLGSHQSEGVLLRSKIQQSLGVAQRFLFHHHRSLYDSLPHEAILRLSREIKCVMVDDADGLQVVHRVGKSFSVRRTPAACFLDLKTPVLYVIGAQSGSEELSYEVLMELCRKCFGPQLATSVANLLYLASLQPSVDVMDKWLVNTQQLAPVDPAQVGALWFSASDVVDLSSRKRSCSVLEEGEVKDDSDHSEKRLRQSVVESRTGDAIGSTGGAASGFPPLPPLPPPPSSEGSDPFNPHDMATLYPPLPASSYPRGYMNHNQHQHPGAFQPNNTNSYNHTLSSDQVVTVGNTMSKEEREGIGRWGEEYVYKQLVESHKDDANITVDWVNQHEESGKPYDITVSSGGKIVEYVEVKATRTMEKAVFEISMNELDQAAIHGSSYCIYRVFNAGNDTLCRVIRMKNPIALVRQKKMQLALVMQ